MNEKYLVLKEKLKNEKELSYLKRENEKQNKKEIKLRNKKKMSGEIYVDNDKKNDETDVNANLQTNYSRQRPNIVGEGGYEEQKKELLNKIINIKGNIKRKKKNHLIKGCKGTSDRDLTKKRERVRNNVRKYREKMTVDQLEEKRRKDRERYRLKKENGLTKAIEDCNEREKRMKRRSWKVNSKNYRDRILAQKCSIQFMENETPPPSDEEVVRPESAAELRRRRGRKKVKCNRAQAYRKLAKAEEQIKILKRKSEKYKKRLNRLNSTPSTSKSTPSPNTRTNSLLKGINAPAPLKKRLLFGETLQDMLKDNLKNVKSNKEKQVFHKAVSSNFLNNYKLVGEAKKLISYKMHKKFKDNLKVTIYDRKKRNLLLTQENAKKIQEFLENDENSKMCPGKNDYIQKKKIKRQKRLLLDSMKSLHKKFKQSANSSLSYTTFCRLKPFWVISPKMKDRETCICVRHANITLITEALFYRKLIPMKKPDEIFEHLVCSIESKMCMFKLCELCKNKKYLLRKDNFITLNDRIKYQQWKTISEERKIKGQIKNVKITTKTDNTSTVKDLFHILNQQLSVYQRHVYTMKHQMKCMQELKKNTDSKTLVIQIDFSENYIAKFNEEIQSMHFGASKKQISLHTGVYYLNGQLKGHPFCSVSDNLDHQAHAIWAHMKKILEALSSLYPELCNIHFYSDGPTSQYRNRSNIFYLITQVPTIFPNVSQISWNYSESGHGKGPMDGVGGVLKRHADGVVLNGQDIPSASVFVEKLKQISVELWEVSETEITEMKRKLPKNIKPIPRIMSAHQITWSTKKPSHIYLRELSCFTCHPSETCSHYSLNPSYIQFLSEENLPNMNINKPTTEKRTSLTSAVGLPDEKWPTTVGDTSEEDELPLSTFLTTTCRLEKKSLPETSMATTVTRKKVNIISNTLLSAASMATNLSTRISPECNLENYVASKSLCYICTRNLTCTNGGLKCKNCPRTFHITCIKKHFTNYFLPMFLCKVCQQV